MRTEILPSLFVSHGAPTLALEHNDTVAFLQSLGAQVERPSSILCVSAHWTEAVPMISAATQPETIYDFGGFPANRRTFAPAFCGDGRRRRSRQH